MSRLFRQEQDALGSMDVPADALTGIHSQRAQAAFQIAGRPVHPALLQAYGTVKLACLRCNHSLGFFDTKEFLACEQACCELQSGILLGHFQLDALQGGAGTATNLVVNEVLCNRALQILGHPCGSYHILDPIKDLNRHQSTNDTYPTALRIAALQALKGLETSLINLQACLQELERRWQDIVKVGRTQLQDAVLSTLGRSMGAYAEAIARDRWRVSKCSERLRVVNLGGTAIGSGLGAPRSYIFRVVDFLRESSGLGLARAENLLEATQNQDALVEVSGILSAAASNQVKIAQDLRLLASGPHCGIGEIQLPPQLAGSSIMPGKVNPVIPEAVVQAGIQVMAHHQAIAQAVSLGCLELNPFLPLVADCLLQSLDLLSRSAESLTTGCLTGATAMRERCAAQVRASSCGLATALAGIIGYHAVESLLAEGDTNILERACAQGLISHEQAAALLEAESVMRLGSRSIEPPPGQGSQERGV